MKFGTVYGIEDAIAKLEIDKFFTLTVKLETTNKREWLCGLAKRFNERVVGQDEAVKAVVGDVLRSNWFWMSRSTNWLVSLFRPHWCR